LFKTFLRQIVRYERNKRRFKPDNNNASCPCADNFNYETRRENRIARLKQQFRLKSTGRFLRRPIISVLPNNTYIWIHVKRKTYRDPSIIFENKKPENTVRSAGEHFERIRLLIRKKTVKRRYRNARAFIIFPVGSEPNEKPLYYFRFDVNELRVLVRVLSRRWPLSKTNGAGDADVLRANYITGQQKAKAHAAARRQWLDESRTEDPIFENKNTKSPKTRNTNEQ